MAKIGRNGAEKGFKSGKMYQKRQNRQIVAQSGLSGKTGRE